MTTFKPIDILLVEDSPSDADLVLVALEEHRIANNVIVVSDGEAAMDYLKKTGTWRSASTPHLIFLDLNLPRKSGREVLHEIRASSELSAIPVVVMTTSAEERDVVECYNLHANSYIVKPLDIEKFLQVMAVLGDYWFQVVRLPNMPTKAEEDAL